MNSKLLSLLTVSDHDVARPALVPQVQIEVAELVVSCLAKAGVEYVFGVPGGAVEPLYNALARSARQGGPRPVVARHEAGAAYMADGYARETGKLGVCVTTSGPGATNLLTGIACARGSSVPLLALTGQAALPLFGRNSLQDSSCAGVDIVGIFSHCTRYSSLVSHVEQAETKVISAILQALRKPYSPTHLSFPVDVLRSLVLPRGGDELERLFRHKPALIDEESVELLERELLDASSIVFFIGDAAADAVDSIMSLVDVCGALFVTTPDAKGLINPQHHAYRGVFGLGGHASAQQALADDPDLVVAFGTGFSEFASNGWSKHLLNQRLVHVDESEDNLIRTPRSKLHVRGSMRTICERLLASLPPRSGPVTKNPVATPDPTRISHVSLQAPDEYLSEAAPIKPQRLMKELSERFPPNTRFLADAGNSMMWTAHYLQPPNRRSGGARSTAHRRRDDRRSGTASWLRMSLEFAPMGWAIGAAVGVARGNPSCPVVCVTGDGSYLMSGQEITTAAEEQLPVVFVLLNDHAYGMVMHGQRLAGAEPIAYELPHVDFRRMAESMGVPGYVVESPADFDRIDFAAMLARRGPTLIDVRIDRNEVPPMMLRLKTLGSVSA